MPQYSGAELWVQKAGACGSEVITLGGAAGNRDYTK